MVESIPKIHYCPARIDFKKNKPLELFEYLCDSGTEFDGLKIWGSPHSLHFPGINPHCTAFTGTEEEIAERFAIIPHDVDILVTHSPPLGILDSVDKGRRLTGSLSLRNRIMEIKPKIHVFSHIHEWGGKILDTTLTRCINCSIMNENYQPVNKPIRINL
jgi:Icc-related predicted phosphoesterase